MIKSKENENRVILHIDMDNYYASVEELYDSSLKNIPFAVSGNPKHRTGIILSKNQIARDIGVKTGITTMEARKICPNIKFVRPNHDKYKKYSLLARKIYDEYTDIQEIYSIDESFLDVSRLASNLKEGYYFAKKIQEDIQKKLGLSISIGVSFNKVFAKMGSDFKKPMGITVITESNFKKLLWGMDVGKLFYVGKKTREKLNKNNIFTIGDLANTKIEFLFSLLGVQGKSLYLYANGLDKTKVLSYKENGNPKSVGNTVTTIKDVETPQEAKVVFYEIAEKLSLRLKSLKLKAKIIEISVKDSNFVNYSKRKTLPFYTNLQKEIFDNAFNLHLENFSGISKIRSLTIRLTDLENENSPEQLSFFQSLKEDKKEKSLEDALYNIKKKYGKESVIKGIKYSNKGLYK